MSYINDLCDRANKNAKSKGFWDDCGSVDVFDSTNLILAKLALIGTEVSEAVEAVRNNDRKNFEEELADIIIRTADLARANDVDLEAQIEQKMIKNESRPSTHGKRA